MTGIGYVAWLQDLRMGDLEHVGGKNASLGEMIGALAAAGVRVPGGFATTAKAYREFLTASGLDRRIAERLKSLDSADVEALAKGGAEIRSWISAAPFPAAIEKEIRKHYQLLEKESSSELSFAV
jgi:pyruvate,water dikinase